MSHRILFVCLGNICRSPSAEAVTRARAGAAGVDIAIDSAGTAGWHIGKAPYGPMQTAATKRGYDMSKLRARQFSAGDFEQFDLIIGMDDDNIANIETLRPAGSKTPVHLMTDYAPASGMSEVPDPYYTRDFDGALDIIEIAADGLLSELQKVQ